MKAHAIKYAARWRQQACFLDSDRSRGFMLLNETPPTLTLQHHAFALERRHF